MRTIVLGCVLLCSAPAAAQVWNVRVEEPTGLYRRTDEVVRVPLGKLGGKIQGFSVTDPAGRELPWQVGQGELLFPASLIPGELPQYRISCCTAAAAPAFRNQILLREIGMKRIELGNNRFRLVIDKDVPAIVEAYSLTTGPQRMLNYVETTPEHPEALEGDIHVPDRRALGGSQGIEGENTGWTTLGGKGPVSRVEILENGPLRGQLRLTREGESWEFLWTASSGALRWKAAKGFRLAAVSAQPYLPFDRFLDGSEYNWPTGPGEDEPPNHQVGSRNWSRLPGGHAVYYTYGENYGALGIVALDAELEWKGAGSHRLAAEKAGGDTEIALTFPEWRGKDTVMEARKENRLLRQPLLIDVTPATDSVAPASKPAELEPAVEMRTGALKAAPFQPLLLDLNGEWELASAPKGQGPPASGWRRVRVPGTVHTQWLDLTKIYTREAEWISSLEWWYRRSFRVPGNFAGRRLRLQFEATDYYADTYLNGRLLGRHEGYIDPYEYDVTRNVLADRDNQLLVRVWTPVGYYWKHRQYTIKGSYGAVDQKPDDITPLGITRAVRLTALASPIIKDIAVNTRLVGNDAQVEVELELEAERASAGCTWELTLSPRNFEAKESIQLRSPCSGRLARLVLPVKNPRLWWTWDHGKPNLYTLEVRLLDPAGTARDARSLAVGIREIEKVGWNFYLNRKRMFIRGTNYYFHLFLSEMDRAKYERDLRLMLQMNVNMIRLHCHFGNPEFYDLADENGVLIWQDFLEAWYPQDTAFSLRAAALYDNHIRYARNHPSVALWATSDEEDLENYRDLTKHLAPRPALLDPQRRPVVRSTGRYGDAHVYYGWYGGSIWQYAQMKEDFVSELGATALPNYPSLIKFMPDRWPIRDHADEWTWRRLQIPEAMRAWGDPGSMTLQEYIPRTQAYVARLFQVALERQRRRKAEGAGGILHFHAIDIWPSVTMAAIDFERVPTKVFDTVRRSFAPVAACLEYDRDRWRSGETVRCGVWAVNDRWEPLPGARIRWKIVDASGKLQQEGGWPAAMDADSSRKIGDVEWPAGAPAAYELRVEVLGPKSELISENLYEFEVVR